MSIHLVVFDMAGTTINDDDGVNRCLRAASTRSASPPLAKR